MSRQIRRVASFIAVLAMVFVAAGCSSDGFPVSYDDQVDLDTGLSNVALNWQEGCRPSLSDDLADNAAAICDCSYARIRAEVPFDAFIEVNDRLGDNPEALSDLAADSNATAAQIVDIVKTCISDA